MSQGSALGSDWVIGEVLGGSAVRIIPTVLDRKSFCYAGVRPCCFDQVTRSAALVCGPGQCQLCRVERVLNEHVKVMQQQ